MAWFFSRENIWMINRFLEDVLVSEGKAKFSYSSFKLCQETTESVAHTLTKRAYKSWKYVDSHQWKSAFDGARIWKRSGNSTDCSESIQSIWISQILILHVSYTVCCYCLYLMQGLLVFVMSQEGFVYIPDVGFVSIPHVS